MKKYFGVSSDTRPAKNNLLNATKYDFNQLIFTSKDMIGIGTASTCPAKSRREPSKIPEIFLFHLAYALTVPIILITIAVTFLLEMQITILPHIAVETHDDFTDTEDSDISIDETAESTLLEN